LKRGNETGKVRSRLLGLILALAMAVTLLPGTLLSGIAATEGASKGIRLYIKLEDGQTAQSVYVNSWGGEVESDSTNARVPSSWGSTKVYGLLSDDVLGFGYVNLTSDKLEGMQLVTLDNSGAVKTQADIWNSAVLKAGVDKVYYDQKTAKWYKDQSLNEEIKAAEVKSVFVLAGTLPGAGWKASASDNEANTFKAAEENKFSISYELSAGKYEFKVLQDPDNKGWNLPWNVQGLDTGDGGNSILTVDKPSKLTLSLDATDTDKKVNVSLAGIKSLVFDSQPAQVVAGETVSLDTDAVYYDGRDNDEGEQVKVSYTLENGAGGASITDGNLSVDKDFSDDSVTVVAAYGDYTQKVTIPVVAKEYKVKINFYNQDWDVTKSDIYIWKVGSSSQNTTVALSGTVEDKENGITWASGTVTLPYNELGLIARKTAGTWDAGQDGDRSFTIPEDKTEITLWYVFGKDPVTEKPEVETHASRYLDFTYTNTAAKKPFFYSWSINDTTKFLLDKQEDGSWHKRIKIPYGVTDVKFVLGLDDSASDWVKDGGDHEISFTADQNLIFVRLDKGSEPVLSAPLNKGYEIDTAKKKVNYYYRDDQALLDDSLSSKKISLEIEGKSSIDLTYDQADKRFEGSAPLEEGRTKYRYSVDGKALTDAFNANRTDDGYSYFDYYRPDITVKAVSDKGSLNYNTNDVIRLIVDQKNISETNPKAEIKSAYVDASTLGAGKRQIDPDNLAVTIACTEDIKEGSYELPVSVIDQFGNSYSTTVTEKVTKRTKSGAADDFDWDEATIYFMVTDRFFDGDSSNDAANDQFLTDEEKKEGITTYGKNAGLYHGGDFKGIEGKLDYLKDLGINTIWITPVVQNIPGVKVGADNHGDDVPYNAAYHGYWASDFTKLNPALGTDADFKSMIDKAHSKGIKIMVDMVVNHAGYGTKSTFGSMLRSGDDIVKGDDQKSSLSDLPDFKTEDKSVRDQLVAWQSAWVEKFGIDYFRVDTVKHVDLATWQALKNSLTDINPSFKMIGEYSGGGYASNGMTLGSGAMDSDLDFDFNDWATQFVKGSVSATESNLTGRNKRLDSTYLTGQFLGSHDEDGFVYKLRQNGMSASDAQAAGLVAASLQLTAKGQPVIYYGEETGQSGANNYPYQDNRYDLDWSKANDSNPVFAHYKKMLSIRNRYTDVYARGDRKTIEANDSKGYDVFTRSYDGTTLYNVLNTRNAAQPVVISGLAPNGVYTDLYSGKTMTADASGSLTVNLPASSDGGTVIFEKKVSGNSSSGAGSASGSGSSQGSSSASEGSSESKPDEDGKQDKPSSDQKSYSLEGDAASGSLVIKDKTGKTVTDQIVEIDGKKYATDKDGSVAVNRSVKIDDRKYVATKDGTLATKGLVKVGKKTFVVKEDQTVASASTVKIGKYTYVACKNGLLAKKTIVKTSDGTRYYADKNGRIVKKKVVNVKGKKYYTDSKGRIVTKKWVRVGKKKYYCSRSGRITKTVKISKKK